MIQKYNSANTSINVVNAVYKKLNFIPNTLVFDYGGGKYDTNTRYMADKEVKVVVFDPYNRTQTHNEKVLKYIETHRPNYIVCSNVLNVIEEKMSFKKLSKI